MKAETTDKQFEVDIESKSKGQSAQPKRLMLICDSVEHIESMAPIARALMDAFDAHVVGVPVFESPAATRVEIRPDLEALRIRQIEAHAAKFSSLRSCLKSSLGGGSSVVFRQDRPASSANSVLSEMLYQDLLICARPDENTSSLYASIVDSVVLGNPRPTLLVPPGVTAFDLAAAAAIAWAPKEKAARAVSSAMPLLSLAEQVTAYSVCAPREVEATREHANRLVGHLGDHDINVTSAIERHENPAPELLFDSLNKRNHAYVVMGAWGHSRLREFLGGGFTRYATRHTAIPLWIHH